MENNEQTFGSEAARERETRTWSMWLHLSLLAGFIVPLAGLVAPVVIWQLKKVDLPGIDVHGKITLNWILSFVIYFVLAGILSFVLIGIPLLAVLGVLAVIFPLVGGIKANNGEAWRYPLSIRFFE